MTIVKQKAVAAASYAKSLEQYIDGKDAVLRDMWNLTYDGDWFREMAITRYAGGHDVARVAGAKNTILFHQVIAFLPEEADINGGKMTPEMCMEYAREYVSKRYPDQQVAFALHEEVSPADGTHRYACHLVINRTDLKTGRRLSEGRGEKAKVERANTIKDMDCEWGLAKVVAGERNSRIHERQIGGDAREITKRGAISYKRNLRLWCEHFAEEAESMAEFIAKLEGTGFKCEIRNNGRLYVMDPDHVIDSETVKQRRAGTAPPSYWFDIAKMTSRFKLVSLEESFFVNGMTGVISEEMGHAIVDEIERNQLIADYKNASKAAWRSYAAKVKSLAGMTFDKMPVFRMPACPGNIRNEREVRALGADYRARATKLRFKYADMSGEAGSFAASSEGSARPPEVSDTEINIEQHRDKRNR